MQRRQFLGGLTVASLGLLAFAPQALALGGVLPDLDQLAPAFDLDGVVPEAAAGDAQASGDAPARGKRQASGEPQAGAVRQAHLALGDFAGQWLVLYFYPRDFTGGCTLEARGFQKDLAAFQRRGAAVVGISADDPDSHASFCGSEELAFPLLSDPGGTVSQRYGSWIAPYSQRHTFLIDPEGVLRARWVAVRPTGHSQEVLSELERLQASRASLG